MEKDQQSKRQNNFLDHRKRIQGLYDFVSHNANQIRFDLVGYKLQTKNPEPFEHIQYFQQAILSGALPKPETLCFIVEAFSAYISKKDIKTLDEAFKLKSIPGKGNPAKQYAYNNKLNSILFDMACLRAENKMNKNRMSLEETANRVLPDSSDFEVDTIVKYYKKAKWDQKWDIFVKIGRLEKGKLIF